MLRIGVLALQGSFKEHIFALSKLNIHPIEVRYVTQLREIDGLIIPGGESSAIGIISEYTNMLHAISNFIESGKPAWGTCAGLILLSDCITKAKQNGQASIAKLHCVVERNYFGSQIDSFVTQMPYPQEFNQAGTFDAVFIRAPIITKVSIPAKVLLKLDNKAIVAIQQDNILGTSFHPELTNNPAWHNYFISLVYKSIDNLNVQL